MEYIFENTDIVRDYECDIQGIVNNANYQHYMEHSRHLYIIGRGVSFAELHEQGIDVVVARFEIKYKVPLRPCDEYVCRLRPEKQGVRYIFHQAISARLTTVSAVRHRWTAWRRKMAGFWPAIIHWTLF